MLHKSLKSLVSINSRWVLWRVLLSVEFLSLPQIFDREAKDLEREVCFIDIASDEIPERYYKESEVRDSLSVKWWRRAVGKPWQESKQFYLCMKSCWSVAFKKGKQIVTSLSRLPDTFFCRWFLQPFEVLSYPYQNVHCTRPLIFSWIHSKQNRTFLWIVKLSSVFAALSSFKHYSCPCLHPALTNKSCKVPKPRQMTNKLPWEEGWCRVAQGQLWDKTKRDWRVPHPAVNLPKSINGSSHIHSLKFPWKLLPCIFDGAHLRRGWVF